jgi:hypothetical protein
LELEKALAASQRETTEAQDAAKKAAKEMQASLDAAQSARAQAEEVRCLHYRTSSASMNHS